MESSSLPPFFAFESLLRSASERLDFLPVTTSTKFAVGRLPCRSRWLAAARIGHETGGAERLVTSLGLAEEVEGELLAELPFATRIAVGVEGSTGPHRLKLYVERLNQNDETTSHRAYLAGKWVDGNPTGARIDHYECLRVDDLTDVVDLLRGSFEGEQLSDAAVGQVAWQIYNEGDGSILTVATGGLRTSFDAFVGDMSYESATLLVHQLAKELGIRLDDGGSSRSIGDFRVQRIAGGIDADGGAFLTFYHLGDDVVLPQLDGSPAGAEGGGCS